MQLVSYSAQYIGAAKPLFSVGECYNSCSCNGHGLDYNQGSIALRLLIPVLLTYYSFYCISQVIDGTIGSYKVYFLPNWYFDHFNLSIGNMRRRDIHIWSGVRVLEEKSNLYAAVVGKKIGHGYAVWQK
ncbi:unnamed protein product [Brassica oleracea var. botrytis]|uniref:Uncharacterized protein n=1 Tax=Brassica oleracea TaxID=3712 RepID=A0A3P6H3X6_BRAOL|nr:unnamed protein product [Brassica oleracea]